MKNARFFFCCIFIFFLRCIPCLAGKDVLAPVSFFAGEGNKYASLTSLGTVINSDNLAKGTSDVPHAGVNQRISAQFADRQMKPVKYIASYAIAVRRAAGILRAKGYSEIAEILETVLEEGQLVVAEGVPFLYHSKDFTSHQSLHLGVSRGKIYIGEGLLLYLMGQDQAVSDQDPSKANYLAAALGHEAYELHHWTKPGGVAFHLFQQTKSRDPSLTRAEFRDRMANGIFKFADPRTGGTMQMSMGSYIHEGALTLERTLLGAGVLSGSQSRLDDLIWEYRVKECLRELGSHPEDQVLSDEQLLKELIDMVGDDRALIMRLRQIFSSKDPLERKWIDHLRQCVTDGNSLLEKAGSFFKSETVSPHMISPSFITEWVSVRAVQKALKTLAEENMVLNSKNSRWEKLFFWCKSKKEFSGFSNDTKALQAAINFFIEEAKHLPNIERVVKGAVLYSDDSREDQKQNDFVVEALADRFSRNELEGFSRELRQLLPTEIDFTRATSLLKAVGKSLRPVTTKENPDPNMFHLVAADIWDTMTPEQQYRLLYAALAALRNLDAQWDQSLATTQIIRVIEKIPKHEERILCRFDPNVSDSIHFFQENLYTTEIKIGNRTSLFLNRDDNGNYGLYNQSGILLKAITQSTSLTVGTRGEVKIEGSGVAATHVKINITLDDAENPQDRMDKIFIQDVSPAGTSVIRAHLKWKPDHARAVSQILAEDVESFMMAYGGFAEAVYSYQESSTPEKWMRVEEMWRPLLELSYDIDSDTLGPEMDNLFDGLKKFLKNPEDRQVIREVQSEISRIQKMLNEKIFTVSFKAGEKGKDKSFFLFLGDLGWKEGFYSKGGQITNTKEHFYDGDVPFGTERSVKVFSVEALHVRGQKTLIMRRQGYKDYSSLHGVRTSDGDVIVFDGSFLYTASYARGVVSQALKKSKRGEQLSPQESLVLKQWGRTPEFGELVEQLHLSVEAHEVRHKFDQMIGLSRRLSAEKNERSAFLSQLGNGPVPLYDLSDVMNRAIHHLQLSDSLKKERAIDPQFDTKLRRDPALAKKYQESPHSRASYEILQAMADALRLFHQLDAKILLEEFADGDPMGEKISQYDLSALTEPQREWILNRIAELNERDLRDLAKKIWKDMFQPDLNRASVPQAVLAAGSLKGMPRVLKPISVRQKLTPQSKHQYILDSSNPVFITLPNKETYILQKLKGERYELRKADDFTWSKVIELDSVYQFGRNPFGGDPFKEEQGIRVEVKTPMDMRVSGECLNMKIQKDVFGATMVTFEDNREPGRDPSFLSPGKKVARIEDIRELQSHLAEHWENFISYSYWARNAKVLADQTFFERQAILLEEEILKRVKQVDPVLHTYLHAWMDWYLTGSVPVTDSVVDNIQNLINRLFGGAVMLSDNFEQLFLKPFLNEDTAIIYTDKSVAHSS